MSNQSKKATEKNIIIESIKEDEPINLIIHSIFVKDISYEAPATPKVFSLPWEPQVKFDIQVMRKPVDEAARVYEVVLHTTVSTKLKNNVTDSAEEIVAFLIDIKLGGIFSIKGFSEPHLDKILSITVPTIIFPYVSETVSSLATRGGFPQFILPPIDFSSIYQEQRSNSVDSNKDDYLNDDESSNTTVN